MGVMVSSGRTPHYLRGMVFVDGTNFLVQLSKECGVDFRAEKPPKSALNLADSLLNRVSNISPGSTALISIRRYWFGSYAGSDEDYKELREALRIINYEPVLFKKDRRKPEKGVDIALTKEMLVNAFHGNFDVAILIAGDEDYVGLVNEVKRFGAIVYGAFFNNGLNDNLRYAFDFFKPVSIILDAEKEIISKILEEVKQMKTITPPA